MNGRTSQTELDELHMATLPDGSHHIHPLLSFLSLASFSSSYLLPSSCNDYCFYYSQTYLPLNSILSSPFSLPLLLPSSLLRSSSFLSFFFPLVLFLLNHGPGGFFISTLPDKDTGYRLTDLHG
ncbi:uncharacterized protein AKAW2_10988A [Aspergillus luchuensis]|uniref:Uncharacterized protein n=1 Tax=Aspergillus kawachii TaxID=1069201 RepID=A0A7R7W059_ASPKA|nr:uncharacterized protein AKAW2_10988A [Aspergillus luchuensis]BCR93942.1 hypothetical protein AKAW2_10988A [Aspergillus luchuensis]